MNQSAGTTWTCPQGHEVAGTSESCPYDGSPKAVPPSAAWGQPTGGWGQPTGGWGQPPPSQQTTWGAPDGWDPPAPPKRALPVGAIIAIVAVGVLVLGGIIGLVSWAIVSSGSGRGFNNVTTLENSVQSTYQNRISTQNPLSSVTVQSVNCVSAGSRQYNCILELSNGNSVSHHVTVSADGNRWASDTTQ